MKKKQIAILLGAAIMSASGVMSGIGAETAVEEAPAAVESVQDTGAGEAAASPAAETAVEEAPAEEVPEEIPAVIEEETFEEGYVDETDPAMTEKSGTSGKKDDKKNYADKDGLIVDDGTVVSNSVPGNPEVPLEEMWDDQMHNRQFPGFEVDPSKYPAANITANTVAIYRFLTEEMELNHAAACGVLANIQLESNFRPLALGDSGTSYGICQWHNGRFSLLIGFCKARDLDYNTLEGQLQYLEWDLTHGYKGVYEMLKKVKDTERGAYEAGYLFCYNFEIPDQVAARSQRRGNLARDEYYGKDFDQLEWELKHSMLTEGEEMLDMMTGEDTAGEEQTGEEEGAEASEASEENTQVGTELPAREEGELPQWQSALGEPSLLL